MKIYNSDYKTIFQDSRESLILIPGKRTVLDVFTLCKVLGGKMNVITDAQNQENVISLMFKNKCLYGKTPLMPYPDMNT